MNLLMNKNGVEIIPYNFDEILQTIHEYNPNGKMIISHRGIENISQKNIYYIIPQKNPECKFLYILSPEHNEEFLYYADSTIDLLELFGMEGDKFYVGIDVNDKKYCIELKYNTYQEIYINYITTLPKGCANKFCTKLSGLFTVMYNIFLTSIRYKGRIGLKDDVFIDGKNITLQRLLEGKPSIYTKYGFYILPEIENKIIELIKIKDIDNLRKITRNIPMIANNINKFLQC